MVEYYSMKRITYNLALREAAGLAKQVELAGTTAGIAEQVVRETLTDQLYAVGYLAMKRLEEFPGVPVHLQDYAYYGGVSRIDHYSATGAWRNGSSQPDNSPDSTLADFIASRVPEADLGFFSTKEGKRYYGVAVRIQDGSVLRVAVEADELASLRSEIGLTSLLQDLASHSEVRYAAFDTDHGLLAVTPDAPEWLTDGSDPFHDEAMAVTSFQALFIETGDETIFEARQPMNEYENVVLRLGLRADELLNLRQRYLVSLVIRTAILLIISIILADYVISRQNVQILEREKMRMTHEIRNLEMHRALQDRLAAMGSLAGGVAHEIRNPLNTINMASQRLEVEFEPASDKDEYLSLVSALRQEASRIERIVQDFLSYSRPPEAQFSSRRLIDVLTPVLETFRSMTKASGVDFQADIPKKLQLSLDEDRIRQAVLNLLRNALEAVPKNTGIIRLSIREEKSRIAIIVEDNGPGVPIDQRKKIFDLYYTTRPEGSGIGLPTVHRIASEHGGRVDVDDSSLGGARFTIILSRELS